MKEQKETGECVDCPDKEESEGHCIHDAECCEEQETSPEELKEMEDFSKLSKKEQAQIIALQMTEDLLGSAIQTKDKEKRGFQLDICENQAIYCLGSLAFNHGMFASEHNVDKVGTYAMAYLDDVKERIMSHVDLLRKEHKEGNLEFNKTEKKD